MPTFATAEVREVLLERPGLQRLAVDMPDGTSARAYALTGLTGRCEVGDRVAVNTTAVELGLGTGGWHVVNCNLTRPDFRAPGPDHVMKLRYTGLQCDVGTDELGRPEVDEPLPGTPVVVASVHSQLAPIAAAFAEGAPGRRLVHVMTDGAALPLALSDLSVTLADRGLVAGTVTAGHAVGGDLEAVNIYSALGLAVHVLGADAVVVAMGPGVVGTGTSLGTTAVEVAPALDAVDALGGRGILCVRASDADPRERHRGISHHSRTAARLSRSTPFVVDVPVGAADLPGTRPLSVDRVPDPVELLARHDLQVTTMGRTVEQDPVFFAAAAAAGAGAAGLLTGRAGPPGRP